MHRQKGLDVAKLISFQPATLRMACNIKYSPNTTGTTKAVRDRAKAPFTPSERWNGTTVMVLKASLSR